MLIMRTSLNKGNKNVTNALRDTKHDKVKTYDKIVANMMETCYSKIEKNIVEEILVSETSDYWREDFESYLTFSKNVFQIIGPEPKLTTNEKFIQEEIERVVKKPGIEIEVVEERVDFLTEKLGKYKYMAYGTTIGFTISFIFMIFYKFYKK